jgi:hypothetical protein
VTDYGQFRFNVIFNENRSHVFASSRNENFLRLPPPRVEIKEKENKVLIINTKKNRKEKDLRDVMDEVWKCIYIL